MGIERLWAMVVAGGMVALTLLTGCPPGVGSPCSNDGQCRPDLYCRGPNDPPVCGIGPRQQCVSDADCGDSVCHAVADACSADGIGSECGPACTGVCADGFRCNAVGACEAIPCDVDFSCQAHQRCDAASISASAPVYDRTHGCVDIACDGHHDDCPTGTVCVNDVCQQGDGVCAEVELVP
jgi:hypothetical protein